MSSPKTKKTTPSTDYLFALHHLARCQKNSPSLCHDCYKLYRNGYIDWRGTILEQKKLDTLEKEINPSRYTGQKIVSIREISKAK